MAVPGQLLTVPPGLTTLSVMTQPEQAKTVFKQIFADGWAAFRQRHPRYAAVDEVVQKMLGCGDPAKGHALYLCPDCLARHVVAFSCKSPFCLSCAKVYGQTWVETVQEMLHPGVQYRHLVLTVPEALRTLLYQHAVPLLEGLMQAARTAMDAVVRHAKRQTLTLGYIVVLQTAGRSATYNPHLHVLMTDGGLRADGTWQPLGYVPYDLLHRMWQEQVLTLITTRLPGDAQAERLVAAMRRRYPRGFVAHLQGDVLPRMKQLTRYLVKYVVSPPMALSRILAYDRVQGLVTYWYRDHLSQGKRKVETVERTIFIGRMVQHILPKGFGAHPVLWVAGYLHPGQDAAKGGGGSAGSGAAGHRRAESAAPPALSGADARHPGARSPDVSPLWHGAVALAHLASPL